MDNDIKTQKYRQGINVLIWLAVLTVVEFLIAASSGAAIALSVIALMKAALIVQYFMHLSRVTSSEEEPH